MKKFILAAIIFSIPFVCTAQVNVSFNGDPLPGKSQKIANEMAQHIYNIYESMGYCGSIDMEFLTFKNREDGYSYLNELFPDNPSFKINVKERKKGMYREGIYLHKKQQAVVVGLEYGTDHAFGYIFHDLSIRLTSYVFGERVPPIWLEDGLANYFLDLRKVKNGYSPVLLPYFKGKIRTLHMLGELDLEKFFNLSKKEYLQMRKQESSYLNALSSITVAAMIKNLFPDKFSLLVKKIKERDTSQEVSELVQEIYPGGVSKLEEDMMELVKD